jgi:thiazole synthase ThiGH ThiG subunit
LAGKRYRSRLIVGTGKYRDFDEMNRALVASGAEIVTVALRRVELAPGKPNLLSAIDRSRYQLLPNTAGCYTAEDAIRVCRLARELGMTEFVKLEVIGDPRTLFPDVEQTLAAARVLVKEGFVVLPYITDDPIACQRLADIGCAAVMPLAAPIGSGLGIRNPYNLRIILETVKVPVIASGGIADGRGIAAAFALGASGVQIGTAYLRCPESKVIAPARAALAQATDESTVITNVMTGRPARGVANRVMKEVGPISPDAPAFPHASTALGPLKAAAEKLGRVDFTNLWAGQAVRMGREMPAAELTRALAGEALARMRQMAG